jgi:hypothetical protein
VSRTTAYTAIDTARHPPRPGVELEIVDTQRALVFGRAPPQQRADPGQQLLEGERLGQVVVGSRVQADYPVGNRIAGRQHENRCPVPALAQPAAHGDAVQDGHQHVQHHQIGAQAGKLCETFLAVAGKLHVVALEPQRPADRVAEGLVVVHHDYPGRHVAPLLVTVPTSRIQPRLVERALREV